MHFRMEKSVGLRMDGGPYKGRIVSTLPILESSLELWCF
jgi:hypothetical protein